MNIKTRREAIQAGEKYFFTGKPCKHGHLTQRYVGNGGCLECIHPKSTNTALAVITAPGEIMVREPRELSPRLALEQQKLQLQLDKHNHRLSLDKARLQLQLEKRAERHLKEERKSIAKTKLVDVRLVIAPIHYEIVVSVVWTFAVMRNPLLRRDEVVTGKEPESGTFVMRCFPEDKLEILRVTKELFSQSEDQTALAREVNKNRETVVAELDQKTTDEDDQEYNDSKWRDDPK